MNPPFSGHMFAVIITEKEMKTIEQQIEKRTIAIIRSHPYK
jgi:hypothetical protein